MPIETFILFNQLNAFSPLYILTVKQCYPQTHCAKGKNTNLFHLILPQSKFEFTDFCLMFVLITVQKCVPKTHCNTGRKT